MQGNLHARFLGEGAIEISLSYPTNCHLINVFFEAVPELDNKAKHRLGISCVS